MNLLCGAIFQICCGDQNSELYDVLDIGYRMSDVLYMHF